MKYFEHYHTRIAEKEFEKFNDLDNIWAVERAVNSTDGYTIVSDDLMTIPSTAYDDGGYTVEYDVYNHIYYVDVFYPISDDDDRIKELNN